MNDHKGTKNSDRLNAYSKTKIETTTFLETPTKDDSFFNIPDPARREALRRQIGDAQQKLAELGEFYPVVVRHADDLRSALGEAWPIDTERDALQLPNGDLVIPILGGGWALRPA